MDQEEIKRYVSNEYTISAVYKASEIIFEAMEIIADKIKFTPKDKPVAKEKLETVHKYLDIIKNDLQENNK